MESRNHRRAFPAQVYPSGKKDFQGGLRPADKVFTNEYANLTCKDIFGTAGKTKTFPKPEVNVPTLPEFDLTDQNIVLGESVILGLDDSINEGPGYQYEWRIVGDSTIISTEKNPQVSPTEDTEYGLRIIYPEELGKCHSVATRQVIMLRKSAFGIKKIDRESEYLLDGAEFILKMKEDGVVVATGTTVDGYINLDDLLVGTYTLKETLAPEGYKLDDREYTITIGADGDITVEPELVVEDQDGKKIIVLENQAKTSLPNTGGPGSMIFILRLYKEQNFQFGNWQIMLRCHLQIQAKLH